MCVRVCFVVVVVVVLVNDNRVEYKNRTRERERETKSVTKQINFSGLFPGQLVDGTAMTLGRVYSGPRFNFFVRAENFEFGSVIVFFFPSNVHRRK